MSYRSTKTYGHEVGLSVAFRQWRAASHCRLLHGYSLAFRFEFEAHALDERHWVVDFGGLKPLKAMLEATFDHKTVVAADDPEIAWFEEAARRGLLELVVLPGVGCEKFAEHVHGLATAWMRAQGLSPRCRLVSVEVKEHGANSAIYLGADHAANQRGV
ncbi:6-pyruvoyl tetrahydrobiopterin synthase [Comamonas serinivorans]|uniref:6-carboxy-5,6,7,8-tetrahydropterin synthase n=1 Tax=Comamonas serinivorans TaxID=1082851 RepID=A0A1Y0EPT5_9BURK|nr:6-carboxytetrahydropterin synthase [Comamonas serinivorans]ARU05657.1 6-pyruvoyl tetrahydrobiopterin synthase [Comamonas serinivorans]